MCGLKGDVKNNVFFLDDQTILYPCGHNVIIYNMEERSQKYIQGIEGSEGISCIAVSAAKKFIAVCEKAEKAVCVVYDAITHKRRRILTSTEINAKEFISAAFSPLNEKSLLCTLSGEPEYKVILWTWDKAKCLTLQSVGVSG
jgi:hypothetical protein